MGHNGVNLNNGVQGFVQSMQDLKSKEVENGVKLYAQPLTDKDGKAVIDEQTGLPKYNTYTSNNKKSWRWGAAKKRQTKSDNAMKAFTNFVNKACINHNLSKDVRISANALVASIFRDPGNAVTNMRKLANLLEDASGINPWKTEMRNNQAKNDVDVEHHQLWEAMQNGEKGLLNPKSDYAKSIMRPVLPQPNIKQKSASYKVVDLEKDLFVQKKNNQIYQHESAD